MWHRFHHKTAFNVICIANTNDRQIFTSFCWKPLPEIFAWRKIKPWFTYCFTNQKTGRVFQAGKLSHPFELLLSHRLNLIYGWIFFFLFGSWPCMNSKPMNHEISTLTFPSASQSVWGHVEYISLGVLCTATMWEAWPNELVFLQLYHCSEWENGKTVTHQVVQ